MNTEPCARVHITSRHAGAVLVAQDSHRLIAKVSLEGGAIGELVRCWQPDGSWKAQLMTITTRAGLVYLKEFSQS